MSLLIASSIICCTVTSKSHFVSSTEIHEFDRLSVLCASLRSLGLKVAAFDDAKSAVVWLADIT